MSSQAKVLAGIIAAAVLAFLAFGVFGVHTLFVDDVVNEALPTFDTDGASGLASDDITETDAAEMTDAMAQEGKVAVENSDDPMPEMTDTGEIIEILRGTFVDRSHPGEGTAVVLSDALNTQRFLRFEGDFDTDNGPDLNVYLVANVNAESDKGLFDDDFIDLGDLKGNRGAQNYEIPAGTNLDDYNTVVVWCVRFGVAFTAADLV